MKRMITATLFLLTAVVLSLVGYFNLCKICENLTLSLNTVIEASQSQNDEKTIAAAEDSVKLWDKSEVMLEIYLDHNAIDELVIDFKSIKRYAEGDREIMLTEVCYECISYLEHTVETATPTWGNIL